MHIVFNYSFVSFVRGQMIYHTMLRHLNNYNDNDNDYDNDNDNDNDNGNDNDNDNDNKFINLKCSYELL